MCSVAHLVHTSHCTHEAGLGGEQVFELTKYCGGRTCTAVTGVFVNLCDIFLIGLDFVFPNFDCTSCLQPLVSVTNGILLLDQSTITSDAAVLYTVQICAVYQQSKGLFQVYTKLIPSSVHAGMQFTP